MIFCPAPVANKVIARKTRTPHALDPFLTGVVRLIGTVGAVRAGAEPLGGAHELGAGELGGGELRATEFGAGEWPCRVRWSAARTCAIPWFCGR